MGISAKDRQYMHLALELAARARGCTSPNPMVGAVLVREDRIVGQGFHTRAGMPHAEVEALAGAGELVQGATLYVNLEPCCHQGRTPPCTEALVRSGIARVVVAMVDPNHLVCGRGLTRLRAAGIEVDCGVLEGEARRLNEAFITYHLLRRPFVIAKWAMTLDGRTSTDTGDSRWISNEASRRYAHELRASVDAIAVGVGTVFFDNPRLNVRLDDNTTVEQRQPRRVIFDGSLRIPLAARCLGPGGGDAVIVCSPAAPRDKAERLRAAGHTVVEVPGGRGRIVLIPRALELLADIGIQSILVEGGRQLHTSLLSSGVADKIVVFIGPQIVGGAGGTSPLDALGIQRMKEAITLKNATVRAFGSDACLEGYINLPPTTKSEVEC
jgi:diaminohydroxyphosphoribosylaminopyrimidine deaminase/5-amino-6-(5-phosphoribosylamino)uracil reductase